MKNRFLEAGKIVNTHGIAGEIKVAPWCDSAEQLERFTTLYWSDGTPVRIESARIHKGHVLMKVEGITNINDAIPLKNKMLFLKRDDIEMPDDLVFIADMIGLRVFDSRLNRDVGTLKDVQTTGPYDMYIIADGQKTYYVPAVSEFLEEVDIEGSVIRIHTIEGMIDDEN